MTIHPAGRKPHRQQPSVGFDQTGTTNAWLPARTGSRTSDEKQTAARHLSKPGKENRICIQTSRRDASHQIEYQKELR
jgi:hypothetical protein